MSKKTGTSRITFKSLPAAAQAFVASVQMLGVLVLGYGLHGALYLDDSLWILLAALTALTSLFGLRVPLPFNGVGGYALTVSDCFIFTGMALYGPVGAVLLAAVDGFVGSTRLTAVPHRFLFNATQIPLVAFLVSNLFYLLIGSPPPLSEAVFSPAVLASVGVCAIAHFVLGSGSVAVVMALASGQSMAGVWKRYFPWASPTVLMNAAAGMLFVVAFEKDTSGAAVPWVCLAAGLLLLSLVYGHRASRSLADSTG